VECLKQFQGILFGYEIDMFSDHKNLVYAATLSESQRVMRWRLILEEFGSNIQHIAGVDNTVADMLSRLPSANCDEQTPSTDRESRHANELFAINETNADVFPLTLLLVQAEQNKEKTNNKSDLSTNLKNKNKEFKKQVIDDVEIYLFNNKIYVPKSLCRRTLDWYHFYLNHPGGDRLAKTLQEVCNWKGITTQAKLHAKHCKSCQKFKRRAARYGHVPPMNIAQLTPWNMVHIDLISPYTKTVKQHQPGNKIKEVDLFLTCMTFIDPATEWFEIVEVPYYDLDEIKMDNQQYIHKLLLELVNCSTKRG
jgi:hypothetical protein